MNVAYRALDIIWVQVVFDLTAFRNPCVTGTGIEFFDQTSFCRVDGSRFFLLVAINDDHAAPIQASKGNEIVD